MDSSRTSLTVSQNILYDELVEEHDQPAPETIPPIVPTPNPSWKFTTLIKKSFWRMEVHFREYAAISVLLLSVFALAEALKYLLGIILPKSAFGPIDFIILVTEMLISAYLSLSITLSLIQKEKLPVQNALKKANSLMRGYLWLFFVTYLLFLSLTPLSLSIFFSIFIVGALLFKNLIGVVIIISIVASFTIDLLWLFWGSFSHFVYLDKGYRGFKNIWVSRALVNQRFWPIFLRLTFLGLITLVFYAPYIYFLIKFPGSKTPLAFALQFMFYAVGYLIITPFTTSFLYEMYKDLPHPLEVKVPKMWIRAIIVTTILSIILGALAIGVLLGNYGKDLPSLVQTTNTLELKNKLGQKEKFFQEELGKLNINPVLTINYEDEVKSRCAPDKCFRELEVIYGGDKPFREKVTEISEEFAANGWKFRKVTESKDIEEFENNFWPRKHVTAYAIFNKGDLSAHIKFTRPNADPQGCFKSKLCEYAQKNQYPYVFSINYSMLAPHKTTPILKNKTSPTPSAFPNQRPTKALAPTPVIISTLDKDSSSQKYVYSNKTYGYIISFPLGWMPWPGYDGSGIRFTDSKIDLSDLSSLGKGPDDTTPDNIIASTHVDKLETHWYTRGDIAYDIKNIEDLYDSVPAGGGLPAYASKRYVTIQGIKALETTGSDESESYFINTQIIQKGLVYSIGGYNYYPVSDWSAKYYLILNSFEFL